MKASIIIPVFNAEKYIEQCIESVQRQTLKELEMICVDDGSTDDSYKLLRNMAEDDNRIRIFRQENQGSGAARNHGIAAAQGKYIAFLDADDFYYDDNALELMVKACEENKIPVCGSNMISLQNDSFADKELFKGFGVDEHGRMIDYRDYQNDYHYQAFIFNRSFLEDNNLSFPDYLRYQDPVFFLKTMSLAKQFWVIPEILYCYREGHQDQKVIAKKIKYTLMGMRDNLQVAVENDYEKLFCTTFDRIEEYGAAIIVEISEEILLLLMEITKIVKDYKIQKTISFKKFLEPTEKLMDSHQLLRSIIEVKQSQYSFKEYFEDKEIKTAAVYGIGMFGKILLKELIDANITVVCCIDQSVRKFEGYHVITPYKDLPECDVLIISPMYSNEIKKHYLDVNITNVVTFKEITEEILQKREK